MKNIWTAVPAYGMALRAPSSATSVETVAVVEKLRERAMVKAGIAARGEGELCPQIGATVRDAAFLPPFPGTAVSAGPPV